MSPRALKLACALAGAVALGIAASGARENAVDRPILYWCFLLGSNLMALWAAFVLAEIKALSSRWGWLGIFGIPGVIVLAVIPKQKPKPRTEETIDEAENP